MRGIRNVGSTRSGYSAIGPRRINLRLLLQRDQVLVAQPGEAESAIALVGEAVAQVGEDRQDPAVIVLGGKEAELREDPADV